ncbi:MAG: arylsulfatase [Spirochaetales bacterium]|nr:arylsulfatase [Spirochaetales bacterium]
MNRKFKKICLSSLGILSVGLAFSEETTENTTNNKEPNIIYILADDLGYGDLGCYGQKDIKTPNLDKMASEGLLFTNHYSGAPVSAPSRCSLLTGKHTGQAYIRSNKEYLPSGQEPLAESETTIATILQQDSYKTALIGKWGLGMNKTQGDPHRHGFDFYYGYLCQREAHNHFPTFLFRDGKKEPLEVNSYSQDLFTKEAINFIESNKDEKFFLYLAYAIPHARLQIASVKPYQHEPWVESKKRYAAMITKMDKDIGKIIEKLTDLNIDKNTLVIFSSDNGPHMEGGANPSYFNSSGGLRGIKRDLYEGGIRVPMIAWWPETIKKGRKTDHISAFQDIFPTLADLTGNQPPANITGISLVPLILGNEESNKKHEYLYWEFQEKRGSRAVRMGDWKGIELNISSILPNRFELYNLKEDPFERNNLADKYPEITAKIKEIMSSARTESKIFTAIRD